MRCLAVAWLAIGAMLLPACTPKKFSFKEGATPSAAFDELPSSLSGGSPFRVEFSAARSSAPVTSVALWYSIDGGTSYTLIDTLETWDTFYDWTVPPVDESLVRLKLVIKDRRGLTSEVHSSWFSIDSTPPPTPALTLVSPTLTNVTTVQLTSSDCSGISHYWIGETTATPSLGDSQWTACALGAGAVTGSVSSGDGSKSIYIFARDASGQISISYQSLSITLDQTPPALALSSLDGGQYIRPGSTQSINWAVSDTYLGATPIQLSSTSDNGVTWSAVATVAAAPASYSWTVPSTETATAKVRIIATDQAGNTTTVASAAPFTVDGTGPSVSAFSLNNNAANSISNFLTARATATDALSPIASVRFSTSSTYADSDWKTFISAGQTVAVPFTPGSVTIYTWLRDSAGNVSSVASDAINIAVGSPPSVAFDSPTGGVAYTTGNSVQIDFTVNAPLGLAASQPLELSYTIDGGTTSTLISNTLTDGSSSGCTVAVGSTGCYTFTIPAGLAGSAFQFMMKVTDTAGASASSLSATLGVQGWKVLAGRNSAPLGYSALSTAFTDLYGYIAVDSNGNTYVTGAYKIYKVSGASGVVDVFIGNGSWGISGNGSPPSSSTLTNITTNAIAVDDNDLVYWVDGAGIRRVNASGNVETYVGSGSTLVPTEGMARSSLGVTSGGDYGAIYSMAFDSSNRLTFTYATFIGPVYTHYILRVNTDDTITILAGDGSQTNPSDGVSALSTGLGNCGGGSMGHTHTLKRGIPDRLIVIACDGRIYQINTATAMTTYVASYMTNKRQIVYDSVRDRVLVAAPGAVYGYSLSTPDTLVENIGAVDASYLSGIARDSSGGIYYSTNSGQRVFYVASNNAQSTFIGIDPAGGDGGPAALAELRSPSKVAVLANGEIAIEDNGNARVRRIQTDGKIQLWRTVNIPAGNPTAFLAKTNAGTQALFLEYYWSTSLLNINTGTCAFLCGGTSNHVIDSPSGTAASSMTGVYAYGLSFDPIRNSNFILAYDSTATYFGIAEIDSSGNITRRMNSSNLAPALPSGTTLSSSINPNTHRWSQVLQSYNGVLYYQQVNGSTVYRMPIAGSISDELTDWAQSYWIDGANGVLYYTAGVNLYKKTLGTGTSGSLIAVLPVSANIQEKSPRANTLILSAGNQVFEFTDSVNIP